MIDCCHQRHQLNQLSQLTTICWNKKQWYQEKTLPGMGADCYCKIAYPSITLLNVNSVLSAKLPKSWLTDIDAVYAWASYQIRKTVLRMRWECRERFPRHQRVNDPDMHHGTCVTHVPWCMPGSLTSGFLWSRWRGKRSRHSRRMRNPHFCVSGKRPIKTSFKGISYIATWGMLSCMIALRDSS